MQDQKDRRRYFRDKRERNLGVGIALVVPLVAIRVLWMILASLSGFQAAGTLVLFTALAVFLFEKLSKREGGAHEALTHLAVRYAQLIRKLSGLTEEDFEDAVPRDATPEEIIAAMESRSLRISESVHRLEHVAFARVADKLDEHRKLRDEVASKLRSEMKKREKADSSILRRLERRLRPLNESVAGFEEQKAEIEKLLVWLKHLKADTEVGLEGLKINLSALHTTDEVQGVIRDIVGDLTLDPSTDELGTDQSLMATNQMALQQFKIGATKVMAILEVQERVITGFGDAENPMMYDDPDLIATLMDAGIEIPDVVSGKGRKAISIDGESGGVIELPLPDDDNNQETRQRGRSRGGSKYLGHLD